MYNSSLLFICLAFTIPSLHGSTAKPLASSGMEREITTGATQQTKRKDAKEKKERAEAREEENSSSGSPSSSAQSSPLLSSAAATKTAAAAVAATAAAVLSSGSASATTATAAARQPNIFTTDSWFNKQLSYKYQSVLTKLRALTPGQEAVPDNEAEMERSLTKAVEELTTGLPDIQKLQGEQISQTERERLSFLEELQKLCIEHRQPMSEFTRRKVRLYIKAHRDNRQEKLRKLILVETEEMRKLKKEQCETYKQLGGKTDDEGSDKEGYSTAARIVNNKIGLATIGVETPSAAK